jgi:hypothetical protein
VMIEKQPAVNLLTAQSFLNASEIHSDFENSV